MRVEIPVTITVTIDENAITGLKVKEFVKEKRKVETKKVTKTDSDLTELPKNSSYSFWTAEEERFLREKCQVLTINEICTKVGRGYGNVYMKMKQLKLPFKKNNRAPKKRDEFKRTPSQPRAPYERRNFKNWSEEEKGFLEMNKNLDILKLATMLGRTPKAVKVQLLKMSN